MSTILDEIRKTVNGAEVLNDWLGEGGRPVAQLLAQRRADICEVCTENVEPGWWDRIKSSVASMIKRHIAMKNQIGLNLTNDYALNMCSKCGCCNRTSVWVPLKHILAHTHADSLAAMPDICWKKTVLPIDHTKGDA